MAYCCGNENATAETSSVHQDDVTLNEQEPDNLQHFQLSSGFILDTEMTEENMEVDMALPLSSTSTSGSFLRRSNSAPLINDNLPSLQADTFNIKRNSPTLMHRHGLLFLPSLIRTSANRLHQIKQEESMDILSREAMHEREVHTAMQISQSWEENMNLNDNVGKPATVKNINIIPVIPVDTEDKRTGKNPRDHQHF